MKTILKKIPAITVITVLLIISVTVILTNHTLSQTPNVFKLGFTGAYPHTYDYTKTSGQNWSWYKDDFKMNMWQGWWVGEEWHTNATAFTLDKLAEENINMDGLFQPDTIRWAGYGRQVILEAEDLPNERFSYSYHFCGFNFPDQSQFGEGQQVRHYTLPPCGTSGTPVTVLSEAKENTIQSLCSFPYDPMYQVDFPYNAYEPDKFTKRWLNYYYIKPRMRILASDATLDPPVNVCKIIIKAYNGSLAEEFIITTHEFRYSTTTPYDGRYLEDFWEMPIRVDGNTINVGRPENAYWVNQQTLANCHVDYEIQWYGEVELWIDYVKVQDEAAYRLLNPDPAKNLDNFLKHKINHLKSNEHNDKMKGIYMEEVDYYNLACLKYLNDSLHVWANDTDYKVIGLVASWSFRTILKNRKPTDYADYFTAVNPPFLMNPQYPFGGLYHEHQ